MASSFILPEAPARQQRAKKTARPAQTRISPSQVVDRLYDQFATDMARLAE